MFRIHLIRDGFAFPKKLGRKKERIILRLFLSIVHLKTENVARKGKMLDTDGWSICTVCIWTKKKKGEKMLLRLR